MAKADGRTQTDGEFDWETGRELERKDAEIAIWIAYADKLEAALKLATGQRSDILMRMHAEEGLRIVRPA